MRTRRSAVVQAREDSTGKQVSRKRASLRGPDQQPVKSPHRETVTAAGTSEEGEPLLAREKEVATVLEQVEACILSSRSMSMYISGPPGTGKTASVNAVLRILSNRHRLITIKVNCVAINTEAALLRAVYNQLPIKRVAQRKSVRSVVESWLGAAHAPVVLVLDEIDYVQVKNRAILYTAFQWPSQCLSLAVLAISNSFDLTERELPKLKLAHPPVVLSFAPYSKTDLQRILTNKLSSASGIDERAVELCSRKVAAMTGDVRHAMQIAQKMLPDISASLAQVSSNEENKPARGSCPQVLGAITNVYRSPLDRAVIPLQQKVLLATMLRLANKHNNTTIAKEELLEAYERVCDQVSVSLADVGGASVALSLLESLSLLTSSTRACQLLVDIPTAVSYIADSSLLANINNLSLD